MKKVMDKLLNTIKFDKKYVLFSIIIVVLGIITGSLFIVILNKADKTLVIEYIQKFIEDIKNNNFNCIDTVKKYYYYKLFISNNNNYIRIYFLFIFF